jgi:hypothetical protein
MHDDVSRHKTQAEEIVLLWDQNVEILLISAKGDDDNQLINAGLNSYSFFYSVRYSKWNFQRYLAYPEQYKLDYAGKKSLNDLLAILNHVEFEAKGIWKMTETKLKKSLPKSEWKKYAGTLDQKYGSAKYAVDLGPI